VLCGFQQGLFAGIAPRANIIPYRVTNFPVVAGVLSNDASLAEGIRRATVDAGCLVLSMSLGNPCFPGAAIGRTVDNAYEMGVIMVAAAGNVTSEVTYPGRYARTVTAGGVSESRRPWTGGSFGRRVDVSAPADDVYRALFRGDNGTLPAYAFKDGDGTSYATTHVSGAAVLWLAYHWADIQRLYGNTWRRVEAFRHCLKESAVPGLNWDTTRHGAGILSIPKLLQTALPNPAELEKVNDLAVDDMV
jgi:subtilisin family serine protease